MKKLTAKEEELMNFFWMKGPLFVREILEFYPEPKPHFNTLSTIVRGLEKHGYLGFKAFSHTHQYFAIISGEKYKRKSLKGVIKKYFDNSYKKVVSAFIEEGNLSIDELKGLIKKIEKNKNK